MSTGQCHTRAHGVALPPLRGYSIAPVLRYLATHEAILTLLLCVMTFSATFLLVGCAGGGSQGQAGVRTPLLISRTLT